MLHLYKYIVTLEQFETVESFRDGTIVYTLKDHAETLLGLLSSAPGPCPYCIAMLWVTNLKNSQYEDIWKPTCAVCDMCRGFVGIEKSSHEIICPCSILGKKESVKRSWIALDEGGYL